VLGIWLCEQEDLRWILQFSAAQHFVRRVFEGARALQERGTGSGSEHESRSA
jgi:hypothetical protein